MSDLFGHPPIPGLRLAEDLLDAAEEQALVAHIDASDLTPFQFGAYEGKRLTRSFGAHYDFARHRLVDAEPIPFWLETLRERAGRFAGLNPLALGHVLLIRYDPGTGIGWHKDRPAFDKVVGISLGSAATLAFRRRRPEGGFDRLRLPLAPRSGYLLSGEARHGWEHGIAAHPALRYSVTFRSFAGTNGSAIGSEGRRP